MIGIRCSICLIDGWFKKPKEEVILNTGADLFPIPIPTIHGPVIGWGRFEHFCKEKP